MVVYYCHCGGSEMLRVTIEVLPAGAGQREKLYEIDITNISGEKDVASYTVVGKIGKRNMKRTYRICGFDRYRGDLALVYEALKGLVG